MAQTVRIECINKTDRYSAWERIHSVGGRNANGTNWKMTQEAAITGIENGTYAFYVERPPGDRVAVVVATSAYGHKYLRTTADADQPNNLLSLPECP